MTTEIIVYRNPLEKALWDSMMNGNFYGDFFTLFFAILALILVFYAGNSLYQKWKWKFRRMFKKKWQ